MSVKLIALRKPEPEFYEGKQVMADPGIHAFVEKKYPKL